jgi:hypothetical protein
LEKTRNWNAKNKTRGFRGKTCLFANMGCSWVKLLACTNGVIGHTRLKKRKIKPVYFPAKVSFVTLPVNILQGKTENLKKLIKDKNGKNVCFGI